MNKIKEIPEKRTRKYAGKHLKGSNIHNLNAHVSGFCQLALCRQNTEIKQEVTHRLSDGEKGSSWKAYKSQPL